MFNAPSLMYVRYMLHTCYISRMPAPLKQVPVICCTTFQ